MWQGRQQQGIDMIQLLWLEPLINSSSSRVLVTTHPPWPFFACCVCICSHGYNWTDFMWDVDFMHPIDPGMAAIADMAVHLLQQTAMGLLLHPLGRQDKELLQERLPPPMHAGARFNASNNKEENRTEADCMQVRGRWPGSDPPLYQQECLLCMHSMSLGKCMASSANTASDGITPPTCGGCNTEHDKVGAEHPRRQCKKRN